MKVNKFNAVITTIYVFANGLACVIFASTGWLDGDFRGYKIHRLEYILISLFLVITSYVLLLVLISLIGKIRFSDRQIWTEQKVNLFGKYVSITILVFQLSYFLFNVVEGVNVAGKSSITSNPIKYIFILINPDFIFLIYYSIFRGKKYSKSNLFVYMMSSISRGWLSSIFIILIIEATFFLRKKVKGKVLKVSLATIVLCLAVPLLYFVRILIRGADGNTRDIYELWSAYNGSSGYLDVLFLYLTILVMRLQQLSSVTFIYENLYFFQQAYSSGIVYHAYQEGLIQHIFKLIPQTSDAFPAGEFLARSYPVGLDLSNSRPAFQTGLAGVLIADVYHSWAVLVYAFSMIFCSALFIRLCSKNERLFELFYLCVVLYLMSGWFFVFQSFVIAVIAFFFFSSLFLFFIKTLR